MEPDFHSLLIDDKRDPRQYGQGVCTARKYADGINALESRAWKVLYLDMDLGRYDKTGLDVIRWMLRRPKDSLPPKVILVTSTDLVCGLMGDMLKMAGYVQGKDDREYLMKGTEE